MQFLIEAIKMRMNKAEELISDIQDKIMEIKNFVKKREPNLLYHKGRLSELSSSVNQYNICIIGVQEMRSRRKGQKVYLNKL